ncbi:hypothetical protein BKA69DRAFT_308813 [Paraphysoderma sedebokerense]|nr:hypothetical protein BKA69DRAFT_308813 [Paraphysoderma sedebokerense]
MFPVLLSSSNIMEDQAASVSSQTEIQPPDNSTENPSIQCGNPELNLSQSADTRKPEEGAEDIAPPKESPETYVQSLLKTVSRAELGHLLAKNDIFHASARLAFLRQFDFKDIALDIALRRFLLGCSLPTESQEIDRFLVSFAMRYCEQNPLVYGEGHETAYLLSYALVLLHTITHKPNVKQKIEYNVWMYGYEREFKGSVNSLMLTVFFENIACTPIAPVIDDDIELLEGNLMPSSSWFDNVKGNQVARSMYELVRDGKLRTMRYEMLKLRCYSEVSDISIQTANFSSTKKDVNSQTGILSSGTLHQSIFSLHKANSIAALSIPAYARPVNPSQISISDKILRKNSTLQGLLASSQLSIVKQGFVRRFRKGIKMKPWKSSWETWYIALAGSHIIIWKKHASWFVKHCTIGVNAPPAPDSLDDTDRVNRAHQRSASAPSASNTPSATTILSTHNAVCLPCTHNNASLYPLPPSSLNENSLRRFNSALDIPPKSSNINFSTDHSHGTFRLVVNRHSSSSHGQDANSSTSSLTLSVTDAKKIKSNYKEYIFQVENIDDMTEWINCINYSAGLKTAGLKVGLNKSLKSIVGTAILDEFVDTGSALYASQTQSNYAEESRRNSALPSIRERVSENELCSTSMNQDDNGASEKDSNHATGITGANPEEQRINQDIDGRLTLIKAKLEIYKTQHTRLSVSLSALETQLKQLSILSPIHHSTRTKILKEVERICHEVKWLRIEMEKYKIYIDVLTKEIEL